MYRVGKIVNTHGLHGEVRVKQITNFTELFAAGKSVFIDRNGKSKELTIIEQRPHKDFHLLQFEGFETVDKAEELKGSYLSIKGEQLTELPKNEFYYHEIIGCTMFTVDNDKLGVIDSILSPGANDVWVVKSESGKEYLIPFIDDVVKEVDVENKKVIIELMEGLLD